MSITPPEPRVVHDGSTRAHIYELLVAIAALLVGVGFLAPEQAQQWLAVAAAALPVAGLILARLNTPTGRHARE